VYQRGYDPIGVVKTQLAQKGALPCERDGVRQVDWDPVVARLDVGTAPPTFEEVKMQEGLAMEVEDARCPFGETRPGPQLREQYGQVMQHFGRTMGHGSNLSGLGDGHLDEAMRSRNAIVAAAALRAASR
jgi:hypothetical protein